MEKMNNNEIKKQMISARSEYIASIKAELLGPGSEISIPDKEHELISSSPLTRYSMGILYPREALGYQDNDEVLDIQASNDETENGENIKNDDLIISSVEEEEHVEQINRTESSDNEFSEAESDDTFDDNLDEEVNMSTQFKPSSAGITFLVRGSAEVLNGSLSFGTYKRAELSDCFVPFSPKHSFQSVMPPGLDEYIVYDEKIELLRLLKPLSRRDVFNLYQPFQEQNKSKKLTADHINEINDLKNRVYRLADLRISGYVRVPHEVSFSLAFEGEGYQEYDEHPVLKENHISISCLKSPINKHKDIWSVTMMVVNKKDVDSPKAVDCIFQPVIEISTENNDFTFVESKMNPVSDYMDEEEKSLDLLYRNKKIYGTGLGTSVDWKINDQGKGTIWSEFFPTREIPPMDFSLPDNTRINDSDLSMKYHSDLDSTNKKDKIASLTGLVDLYQQWIDQLRNDMEQLDQNHLSSAQKNIDQCQNACDRMRSGIKTLEDHKIAYEAFCLANRAMFMQRIHIEKQNELAKSNSDRYPGDPEISDWMNNIDYYEESDNKARWRPFQLAFILMDINSIVFPKSSDRRTVDLIWFPTGGGKTEAYLGLAAFTIFYRRLAYPENSGGTTVLMRYTLRLLTAQQFTRASTLICACEYIRQDGAHRLSRYPSYDLGKEPISIGLWIGSAHTPNTNKNAKKCVDELGKVKSAFSVRNIKDKYNKFQVLKCPWCGTKMVKDDRDKELVGKWGYLVEGTGNHFYMFCPNEDCIFTNKLPIQVVDEELYRNPPTLLFGTVDKFAMMAWDGRSGSFFGANGSRPPELIIQDELHLISGALGTMVGLYETAIDKLCQNDGNPAKIIASTATIRRAKEQCSVLYNRDVVQFPSPGIDAEDSFFAREEEIDHDNNVYGRLYVGVMPSGKTKAMMEIRLIASLLQEIYMRDDLPDEVRDKFWTLTVYFNSLRDLGKTSTLVEDDIKDFIVRIANRKFTGRRTIRSADELTSRVSTTELNETLDRLEKREFSAENRKNKRYASNVLLATNMISVGIDIARLNVMHIVGQPKLTSEYIQASSRVGRSYPGIVFVQYDATRSRDRSHYEKFVSYHDSFYRYVEPTGATPFSKPARERALHAVVAVMLRNATGLLEDPDASYFDKESFSDQIKDVEDFIVQRVKEINTRADRLNQFNNEEINMIKDEIEAFINFWSSKAEEIDSTEDGKLFFGRKFMVNPPSEGQERLFKPYKDLSKDNAIETLTSMRNVDTNVIGEVIIWGNNTK